MSRKVRSQDNAACEGFFGGLKTDPRDRRAFTAEQFINEVDGYIRWYNETRIKMSLGGRSLIEYRRSLGLMTENKFNLLSAPPVGQFWVQINNLAK